MTPDELEFEARMARLAASTEDVRAPSGLEGRILRALSARGAQLSRERRWDMAWRSARGGAGLALVAAVVSIVFALLGDRHLANNIASFGEDRIGVGGEP
ncbi:MAG: hypothetical protein U0414_04455 [Polyangiaceae bacterium]